MIIRVLTDSNFIDIEPDGFDNEDVKALMQKINDMVPFAITTKHHTTMIINPVNVVAIDIINTPPIQEKE